MHGADQQAAVAAALDRELRRRRVLLRDQLFGGRDEVVEHVLLVLLLPALCHASPYSPPPRRFAHSINAAHLHPRQRAALERRRQRDVEAAVAVKNRGVPAVHPDIFPVDENIGIRVPSLLL